jgi:hypothetical protein
MHLPRQGHPRIEGPQGSSSLNKQKRRLKASSRPGAVKAGHGFELSFKQRQRKARPAFQLPMASVLFTSHHRLSRFSVISFMLNFQRFLPAHFNLRFFRLLTKPVRHA